MKAVIIGGGIPPSKELLEEELSDADVLICADGGGDCLYKYNKVPDYLLGDFDSINKEVLEFFMHSNCVIETYPAEKDCTDSEICFNKAIELKVSSITMLGFTGSRLDHFLGNLGLLKKSLDYGVKSIIRDNNNKIFIINEGCTVLAEEGKFISLQAYSDVVENLCLVGVKYPLRDYMLFKGDLRTISNEFVSKDTLISFDLGLLLIIIALD
ncbi:MAG: thiamine diphosphokinase [Clostridiaceae bacterium]|nr:thiamine diphosphokinase [Clostridiaceae bacterium]